jgi:hypothetical protein
MKNTVTNSHASPFAGLQLEVGTATRMPILHPRTNQPLPGGWIEVYSNDGPRSKTHQRDLLRARQALAARGGRTQMTPEEQDAAATDLLVTLTGGWSLVDMDGNPIDIPFSPEAARELYDDPAATWLRSQVDAWSADRANFIPDRFRH